jgi:hypothetical protein
MAGGKKTKRWGMLAGGLALFGAGAAANKSGAFSGLSGSLAKLKPAVANVANSFLPNLGKLFTGDRPVTDYLPNGAAVQDAFEQLYGSTPAGQEARAEGLASWLGGLLLNPITWVVAAVGAFLLLRKR